MKVTKISTKGFYVYLHINPTNGKVFYIGKGSGNRAYQTRSRNDYWKNTVNKYGIEVCIVSDNMTNEEAASFEVRLISFYGLDNLCNMTAGGDGCVSLKQSSRDKISNSLKGKVQSQESRDKRSRSLKITWANEDLRELKRIQSKELNRLGLIGNKGMPSKKKGLPFDGDKIKLSESLKKHWANHDIWNKKKIDQCDIDNIIKLYSNGISILSLSKQYKFSRNVIYRVLNENNITVKPKKQNGNITTGS